MFDLVVRSCGLIMAVGPILLLIYCGYYIPDSRNDGLSTLFYIGFLGIALFSAPGIYIAIRGQLTGEEATSNRTRAIFIMMLGVGMIIVGFVVTILVSYLGVLAGFVVVWHGIIGLGAVHIALGLASWLSGRNLIDEMSKIKFGK